MASIFSRIVAGEIPCYKILDDENFLAFLDVFPLVVGHTLVIPKKEIDDFFDMDDQTIGEMMIFSKNVAEAIKKAIPCIKVGVSVIGLEVAHAHIHLIPLNDVSNMNFSQAKLTMSHADLNEIAANIRANL